jgi:hypothetical protein
LFRSQTVSLEIEKNGGRLFRRPKLTLSCSAEGKEGRNNISKEYSALIILLTSRLEIVSILPLSIYMHLQKYIQSVANEKITRNIFSEI